MITFKARADCRVKEVAYAAAKDAAEVAYTAKGVALRERNEADAKLWAAYGAYTNATTSQHRRRQHNAPRTHRQ